jgi:hypothetical protein
VAARPPDRDVVGRCVAPASVADCMRESVAGGDSVQLGDVLLVDGEGEI